MSLSLDDIIERLNAMDPAERQEVQKLALDATKDKKWIPNPGPQTTAYFCNVDQMLYGGEAGGGKSDLIIGRALQEHTRSLLLRRVNKDVSWLVDRTAEILDTRQGYNGQDNRWSLGDGRVIDFGGLQHPGDEQRYKGRPKDLIGFDEASDFLESQVDFVLGWLRTTKEGQHCQAIFATNPPTTAEGEWIVRWFAPWVDPEHPLYPYPMGEPLWTCRGSEDEWLWFEEPGEREVDGQMVETVSRTFIRSGLGDNPDLNRTNYSRQLALLPAELRKRYADGDFTAEAVDDEFQVIPTEWIRAAQSRWVEDGGERMEAIGVDIAQGGKDNTVLAPRWQGKGSIKHWVDKLVKYKGAETPDGSTASGFIMMHLKHAAQVNIDMGGGYGGSTYEHLRDAEISVLGFVPSAKSDATTSDGRLKFANVRSEAIWRVRELLDPESQELVALPPDAMLRADLASFRWRLMTGGVIQVRPKEEIKKLLGRSPDDGEAVIIALSTGSRRVQPRLSDPYRMPTQAKMGHSYIRRRR